MLMATPGLFLVAASSDLVESLILAGAAITIMVAYGCVYLTLQKKKTCADHCPIH